jgi:flagellar P-ring protein precursor FlgI
VALRLLSSARTWTAHASDSPGAPSRRSARWGVGLTAVCMLAAQMAALAATPAAAESTISHPVLLRDISDVEGVRDNQLVGYGLVAGLQRTGDSQQTYFTVQTLANAMLRMGIQINAGQVVVKNVAAVFVTASLPAFSTPGMKIDITVSSVGDAKSLEGGVLLMTALHGPDGQVYAVAQGPLILGGYSAGTAGNLREVNDPTVGRVPNGAIVERAVSVDLSRFHTVSLVLRQENFTAARDAAAAINTLFQKPAARAVDGRHIDVNVAIAGMPSVPLLISRLENVSISVQEPAKVIINERTGTIILGGDVRLSPVSVIQGSLSIDVATTLAVSQPTPFSKGGTTQVVPETSLSVNDPEAKSIRLENGADVNELLRGLHAIGATAHDIVAILQAIKAAGGLQADLEVI